MIRIKITYKTKEELEALLKTIEKEYAITNQTNNYITKRNYNTYKNCFIEAVKKE